MFHFPSKLRHLRSVLLLGVLPLFWSVALGWGIAHAAPPAIGTVDPVGDRYQLGQELYLKNCSTCHLAVPPAVFPSQTWAQLLQTPAHYTTQIQPPVDPDLTLIWVYLRDFSRPFPRNEAVPFRVSDSRLFKALHPRVQLPRPLGLSSCATCHPGAARYDFRSLTPEWENAP